jgi:hypothetical protein
MLVLPCASFINEVTMNGLPHSVFGFTKAAVGLLFFALVASAARIPNPATDTPATDCTFTGSGRRCVGTLSKKPGSWTELYNAYKVSKVPGNQANRISQPGCINPEPCQHAQTWANKDMPNFPFKSLPADQSIVIGAIRWAHNQNSDRTYGVGKGLENSDQGLTTIIVATGAATGTAPDSDGTVIGSWTMYRKDRDAADSIAAGLIVLCSTKPHKRTYPSGFLGCNPDKDAIALSQATGLSFKEIVDASHCNLSTREVKQSELRHACDAQRTAKWDTLRAKAKAKGKTIPRFSILSQFGNETIDDYWFGCSLGCCTAEGF